MINLSSSTPFDFDVLERVWKVKHVFYTYLKVFGYMTFIRVTGDKRFKLDNNSDMKMMSLAICYKILKKRNKCVEVNLNLT